MKRILIVEDDRTILQGLEEALKEEHYDVLTAADGERGYTMARRENIDLVILDIMLPGKNGMDICRDLRKDGVTIPILMLTSKKAELDEVMGFELGANDYVTKPFSMQRLLARIRNLLRGPSVGQKEVDTYSFGDVTLDFKKLEAHRAGTRIPLSAKEFEVMKYFILHESEVVSRDALLDEVWGYETFPTTRTVDNYILSLRKKIERDSSHPLHLVTVHTVGYKFIKGD